MRLLDPHFVGPLLLGLLLVQAVCWLLARGLGLRLSRSALAGGWIAPVLVLTPWLAGPALLVPCDILAEGVPGAPHLQGSRDHDLLNDSVYQLLPWELEVRHALRDGRLPLWSDTVDGGSSPWANPQAGALSPLQMAVRLLPIEHHLLGALALKLLVAFQGTWLLARAAGRGHASSLLAAGGFALGGGLFSWALFPVTATAAWIPWVAAGTVRLFRHPGRRAVATTAAATAALLLSGHPETAAFGGLFAAACGLGLRRRALGIRRGLAAASLAAGLGFALAAPHLLPFLEAAAGSQRAADTLAHARPAGTVIPYVPATWFAPGYAAFLLAPTGPHAYGAPYREPFHGPFSWADSEAGYAGLVAFAGAVLAALLGMRDRRARPFVGFAVLGLLLVARFLPLALLLHAVPPLRVPAWPRLLPAVSLSLCVAGAFGTDLLFRLRRLRRRDAARAAAALALAALASLAVTADAWTAALWAGLAAAVVLAGFRPRWGAAALGLVLLADLVPWSRSQLPSGSTGLFYPRTALMDLLVRETGDPARFRAVGADYLVYPNLLPVYGLADPRMHNPLASAEHLRVLQAAFGFHPDMESYFSPFGNLDHPLLDFLGVRAVVSSPSVPPSRTLVPVDGGRFFPFSVLRNPDALPRWFFPDRVAAVGRSELGSWIAGLRDPWTVAVAPGESGLAAAGGPGRPGPRVVAAAPGRVELEVPAPARGGALLASSVPYSSGWSARSGGRKLATLRVNGAFLGVRLPPGTSRVEIRFLPPGFMAGCIACGVALASLFALLASGRGRHSGRYGRDLT